MVTPRDIEKRSMTPEKRKKAKHDYFAFYIGRPISYVLSIPFICLHVNPNVISLLSVVPAVVGFLLLGFGVTKNIKVIGTLLFVLWNFMDGVDGNTARYNNQTSKMGELWDAASGYIAKMLSYFAMGLCVMNTDMPHHSILRYLGIPDYYYVALAGLTAMNMFLYRIVMYKKMILYNTTSGAVIAYIKKSSVIRIIVTNFSSTAGFMQVFMLVAVITGYVREFTVFYFILQFAIMMRTMSVMLKLNVDDEE